MAASGGKPPPDDDTAFSVMDEESGPDVEILEEGGVQWEAERRLFGVSNVTAAREF